MSSNEVIDLTDDTCALINHCELANIVIDLEDSVLESPMISRTSSSSLNKKLQTAPRTKSLERTKKSKGFGDCPICWDELGNNPLASTKCGHVYCLKCIEKYLRRVKKCPTCRCVLKGSSAYHPLYLSRQ